MLHSNDEVINIKFKYNLHHLIILYIINALLFLYFM